MNESKTCVSVVRRTQLLNQKNIDDKNWEIRSIITFKSLNTEKQADYSTIRHLKAGPVFNKQQ